MKGQTLVYINSKGQSSKTGRLAPKQFKFLKPLTQEERRKYVEMMRAKYPEDCKRISIYDEDWEPPSINYTNGGEPVDILDAIHAAFKE